MKYTEARFSGEVMEPWSCLQHLVSQPESGWAQEFLWDQGLLGLMHPSTRHREPWSLPGCSPKLWEAWNKVFLLSGAEEKWEPVRQSARRGAMRYFSVVVLYMFCW